MTKLLNETQTAEIIGCSVHKLRRDRWAGGGIPFVKLTDNGTVRYRIEDVEHFICSRIRKSTSDHGGGSHDN